MSHRFSGNHGPIMVELYIRDECISCDPVQEALKSYCYGKDYLSLQVVDLDNGGSLAPGRQAYITPALWVNDVLWSLGAFDLNRFDLRIKKLINGFARDNKRV